MKEELLQKWIDYNLIKDKRVFDAFKSVNREDFVLPGSQDVAYYDGALSIGYKQTISQPSTVLAMIQALELKETDKVLEVGTGSGYGAAILAKLAKKVYTVEIIPELVKFAKDNLAKANIKNVEVIKLDGGQGYEKQAPYDKIIITAACSKIPKALVEQLKEKGIIVAPVGGPSLQKMIKGIKNNNQLNEISLGDYIFVPLTGKFGK